MYTYMYLFLRFGGWVVDGFPLMRENWTAMLEHELLPDFVIVVSDETCPEDYLLTRFTQQHGLPERALFKVKKESKKDSQKDGQKEKDREKEKDSQQSQEDKTEPVSFLLL